MKPILNIFVFSLLFFQTHAIAAAEPSPCLVGYGYSTHAISKIRQEHFYMGFRYGLSQGFKKQTQSKGPCNSIDKVEIVLETEQTGHTIGALTAFKNLIKKNPIIIAGFPSSHEALLVANAAQKNRYWNIVSRGICQ